MSSASRTIQVLHGTAQEGPCCVLVKWHPYPTMRCYCNDRNPVIAKRVHTEPLENVVSCPVCEAYRQRLVRFWEGDGLTLPRGSEGQHA